MVKEATDDPSWGFPDFDIWNNCSVTYIKTFPGKVIGTSKKREPLNTLIVHLDPYSAEVKTAYPIDL